MTGLSVGKSWVALREGPPSYLQALLAAYFASWIAFCSLGVSLGLSFLIGGAAESYSAGTRRKQLVAYPTAGVRTGSSNNPHVPSFRKTTGLNVRFKDAHI